MRVLLSSSSMLVSQIYYGTECTTKADSWPVSHIWASPANHHVLIVNPVNWGLYEQSRVENQSRNPSPDDNEKVTLDDQ